MQSHEHIITLALPVDLRKVEIKELQYLVKHQTLLSLVRFSTPLILCLLAEVLSKFETYIHTIVHTFM